MELLPVDWQVIVDKESSRSYYFNERTGETQWDSPLPSTHKTTRKKQSKSNNSLSALSKQLRELQNQNNQQNLEIERLERQNNIAAEIKGTSVAAIKEELRNACQGQAHAELLRENELLRERNSKLQQTSQSQQPTSDHFDRDAADQNAATLELRIGELQEVEDELRSEVASLYERVGNETARVAKTTSTISSLRAELLELQETKTTSTVAASSTASDKLHARILELDTQLSALRSVESHSIVLSEQLANLNKSSALRNEQHNARFKVQDSRISDLTGQLSSLYTAFEMLQQENHEILEHAKTQLHASDSQIALQLHQSLETEDKEERSSQPPPLLPDVTMSPNPLPRPPSSISPPSPSPSSLSSSSSSSSSSLLSSTASTTAATTATSTSVVTIIIQGVLWKRPKRLGNKKRMFTSPWKKRWFELRRGGSLVYRESFGGKVKGSIGITKHSRMHPTHEFPKQPFAFVMQLDSLGNEAQGVKLYLAAGNQEDLESWVKALGNVVDKSSTQQTVETTPHTANTANTSLSQEEADHLMALRMAQEFENE